MAWLREKDPYNTAYRCEKRNISDSYIPKRFRDCDDRFAIVDSRRQPLVIKGVRCAQVI